VASHLILDNLSDTLVNQFIPDPEGGQSSALMAMLWPFYSKTFAIAPFKSLSGHLAKTLNPITLGAEVVGAAILAWDFWKNRHESEILQMLRVRRHRNHVLKRHQRSLE
jgi:hypothetical protein